MCIFSNDAGFVAYGDTQGLEVIILTVIRVSKAYLSDALAKQCNMRNKRNRLFILANLRKS